MRYADSKDIKRSRDLGSHSGAVHSSTIEIARGKASSMAKAITDRRKILGRLEAIASEWRDYEIISPFIERCIQLWPNSDYEKALEYGKKSGRYLNNHIKWESIIGGKRIGVNSILNTYSLKSPESRLIDGTPCGFDEIGIIIYNTLLRRNLQHY
jgi:hypothetical protein